MAVGLGERKVNEDEFVGGIKGDVVSNRQSQWLVNKYQLQACYKFAVPS